MKTTAMTNDLGNCLQCGAPATYETDLATGRVMYDDVDKGQLARLCEVHRPSDRALVQPTNSLHVWFRWGGIVDTHEQALNQMRNERARTMTSESETERYLAGDWSGFEFEDKVSKSLVIIADKSPHFEQWYGVYSDAATKKTHVVLYNDEVLLRALVRQIVGDGSVDKIETGIENDA